MSVENLARKITVETLDELRKTLREMKPGTAGGLHYDSYATYSRQANRTSWRVSLPLSSPRRPGARSNSGLMSRRSGRRFSPIIISFGISRAIISGASSSVAMIQARTGTSKAPGHRGVIQPDVSTLVIPPLRDEAPSPSAFMVAQPIVGTGAY